MSQTNLLHLETVNIFFHDETFDPTRCLECYLAFVMAVGAGRTKHLDGLCVGYCPERTDRESHGASPDGLLGIFLFLLDENLGCC